MKRRICFCLVIFWMIVIFWFSSQDGSESSFFSSLVLDWLPFWPRDAAGGDGLLFGFLPLRKLAHMAEYAVLGSLVYFWLKTYAFPAGHRVSGAWLFSLLYAATDEVHQLFVPGRAGRLIDVGIDGVGAALGILLVWFLGAALSRWRSYISLKNQKKSRNV